jgi:hypothetical protein
MRIPTLREGSSIFLALILLFLFLGPSFTLAQQPGQIKSYYSPIIRIEPEKGFELNPRKASYSSRPIREFCGSKSRITPKLISKT